jgi:hypothetical protein
LQIRSETNQPAAHEFPQLSTSMATYVQRPPCVPKIFEDILDLVRGTPETTPGPYYDVVLAALQRNPKHDDDRHRVGLEALFSGSGLVSDANSCAWALRIYQKFVKVRVPPPRVHKEDGPDGAAVWCLVIPKTVLPGNVTLRCTGDFVKRTLDAALWSPERFEIVERYLWIVWQALRLKDPYPWKTIIDHPRCPWRVQVFAKLCLAGETPLDMGGTKRRKQAQREYEVSLKGVLRAAVAAGWRFGFGLGERHSYRQHWTHQSVDDLEVVVLMLAAGFPPEVFAIENLYLSNAEWALAKLCGSTKDDGHARCFRTQYGSMPMPLRAWPVGSETFPLFIDDERYAGDSNFGRFRMSNTRRAWCVFMVCGHD